MSDGLWREIVLLSISSTPFLSRLTMVPSIVTATPPAEIVVSAMAKAEGFAVKVWPAAINTVEGTGVVRGMMLVPMARTPD